MAGKIQHVRKGEPFRFRAGDFNMMADAANAHTERQLAGGAPQLAEMRRGVYVRVQNLSGEDQEEFSVLGVWQPWFYPGTVGDNAFKRTPVLDVRTPDEDNMVGRYVVLQEPLKQGDIGWAIIAGFTAVKINVLDEDEDTFADICDGVTAYLSCGASGTAYVVWREKRFSVPTTGEQWAYVIIGTPNWFRSDGSEYQVWQLQDDGGVLKPTWDYVRMHQ